MNAKISLQNVTYRYSIGTPFEKAALENVTLDFEGGIITGLMGHTGSGKSTIAQLLNGLLRPTEGKVLLDGRDIWEDPKKIGAVRFRVGLVFQYPEYQLFEETVARDIAYGPTNMGLSPEEILERVQQAARFTGISPEVFDKSPFELSGGQKRRVAIAGVMAMEPGILILDEPTAGLDPAGCQDILDNIRRYRDETGATILLVTHDMSIAARMADRLLVLSKGSIAFDGTPQEVFSHVKELREIGLDIPVSTSVAEKLRNEGLALPDSICTVAELRDAILSLRGGNAVC